MQLGLEDKLEVLVGALSGGQRQALSLLMATLIKPEVLLLDEHTAALDPKTSDLIIHLSDKICKRKENDDGYGSLITKTCHHIWRSFINVP